MRLRFRKDFLNASFARGLYLSRVDLRENLVLWRHLHKVLVKDLDLLKGNKESNILISVF
jgi:hypothetical protein